MIMKERNGERNDYNEVSDRRRNHRDRDLHRGLRDDWRYYEYYDYYRHNDWWHPRDDWYYYDAYYNYDDWGCRGRRCDHVSDVPTHSPIVTTTAAPTPTPPFYTLPNGAIGCFPADSSSNSGFKHDADLVKTVLHYEYELEAEDGYSGDQAVANVETALATLFKEHAEQILDCDSVGKGTHGGGYGSDNDSGASENGKGSVVAAIVGVDPSPADEVSGK